MKETKITARSTSYATLQIERKYPFAPAKVFGAWAEPASKARWFIRLAAAGFRAEAQAHDQRLVLFPDRFTR